jgi:hypothetical protein
MTRIKFLEKNGQRNFLKKVLRNLNAPSLRELVNYGVGVPYSTLKSYYSEFRLLPEELFLDLIKLSNLSLEQFKIKYLGDFWGQKKGGKKSKRKKLF